MPRKQAKRKGLQAEEEVAEEQPAAEARRALLVPAAKAELLRQLRARLHKAATRCREILEARRSTGSRRPAAKLVFQVGPAWDLLRGSQYDVLRKENVERLQRQVAASLVVHFGTECKTFSRAREIQRPGLKLSRPL